MSDALDDASSAPYYIQIVGNIRYDIDSGKLHEGDKLPSEKQLCDLYHVSRVTVRHALDELAEAGYLEKRQGKGTFVKSTRRLAITQNYHQGDTASFTDMCEAAGYTAGSREVGLERRAPTEEEARALGISTDDTVIVSRRLRTANDVSIMYEENVFPLEPYQFIEQADLSNQSLYQLIAEKTGQIPSLEGACSLRSMQATGWLSELLQVPTGEPLFVLQVGYCDQNGKPMYFGTQYIIGARYSFAF